MHATDIRKKLHADATLSINKFNLNETLEHLGKPIALNKNALEEVSLSSKINIQDSNFLFNQLQIKMDKTKIFGNVIISKNNGIHFNLIADQINIDDYLSDKKSSENQVKVKENEGKHPDSPWKMEGRLKISTLNTHKIKLTNFNSALNMHNDIIQLGPLSANLYQGNLKGSVTIDQHQKNKTAIYIKQVASNINTGEFLVELFDSKKLSGSSNINADLSAVLDEKTSFLSALNGKIDFSMLNGSMQGIDIIYQLSRAHAFIKHLPSPKAEDTKQTQFATLTANASLENGLMNTDNLAINSSYLKVNGKGYTNLVTKEIHYRLNALAQPRLANENMQIGEEITTYQIPIKVSGKLNKPSVNLDFVELAKNFYSKKIQKPIAEQLDKNIKHLKNNLEEKVNDKLKELSPTKFLKNLIKSKEASGETTSNEKSFDLK